MDACPAPGYNARCSEYRAARRGALTPPPSGNGAWKAGAYQSVKDRWVFPLRRDASRPSILVAQDASITRRLPNLIYREPGGVPWRSSVLTARAAA